MTHVSYGVSRRPSVTIELCRSNEERQSRGVDCSNNSNNVASEAETETALLTAEAIPSSRVSPKVNDIGGDSYMTDAKYPSSLATIKMNAAFLPLVCFRRSPLSHSQCRRHLIIAPAVEVIVHFSHCNFSPTQTRLKTPSKQSTFLPLYFVLIEDIS